MILHRLTWTTASKWYNDIMRSGDFFRHLAVGLVLAFVVTSCAHSRGRRNIRSKNFVARNTPNGKETNKREKPVKRDIASADMSSASGPTEEKSNTPFDWPVKKPNMSSGFGERWGRPHEGIDISAPIRTPVLASSSGRVIYSARKIGDYGNMIVLMHPDELSTVYAHNSKNLVKPGDWVEKGQTIAYLGNTGASTGPHLHFEIRKGIEPVNPLDFLPPTP